MRGDTFCGLTIYADFFDNFLKLSNMRGASQRLASLISNIAKSLASVVRSVSYRST
jgi:hypothetical protein